MTIEFLISREIIFSVSYFSSELGTLHSSYDFFMEYLEIFLNEFIKLHITRPEILV